MSSFFAISFNCLLGGGNVDVSAFGAVAHGRLCISEHFRYGSVGSCHFLAQLEVDNEVNDIEQYFHGYRDCVPLA